MVQSHDEKEVTGMAMSHAKNMHKMDVSEHDMRKRMMSV